MLEKTLTQEELSIEFSKLNQNILRDIESVRELITEIKRLSEE